MASRSRYNHTFNMVFQVQSSVFLVVSGFKTPRKRVSTLAVSNQSPRYVLSNSSGVCLNWRLSLPFLQEVRAAEGVLPIVGMYVPEGSVPAALLGYKVAPCHFYSAWGRLCVRTMLMADMSQRERVQQSQ